jgi:hypothetical protein
MIRIPTTQRTDGNSEDGWRALAPLAHPLALVAAASLLLNALVWQPLFASWWTGKIGDAAWMVIGPLLVAAALSALRPVRDRLSRRALGALACALTALAFGAAKAVPAVNSAVLLAGAALGYAFKLRLDPTDLLALPFVLVAGWVWQHTPPRPGRALQAAALGLAALAVLADSAQPTNLGFSCLVKADSAVYVIGEMETHPSIGQPSIEKTVYRSDDGGVNWTYNTQFDASKATCEQAEWPVSDPSRAGVGLYYVPGKGLYASSDNGQNLKLERPLPSIRGLVVHATTGNIIVAAATDGVWVRTAAGAWTQTLKQP